MARITEQEAWELEDLAARSEIELCPNGTGFLSQRKAGFMELDKEHKTGKSPFENIPYITADITTQEIVELLRESRAGI